jgi:hypothetical protein
MMHSFPRNQLLKPRALSLIDVGDEHREISAKVRIAGCSLSTLVVYVFDCVKAD